MKKIVVFVVVLLIFFACAAVGYSIASRFDLLELEATIEPVESEAGEQYRLLIVQVDQLDASQPRLVSVWYVSLFFIENAPATLTFAQLYAPYSTAESAQRLEQSFSMIPDGGPAPAFLRTVERFRIGWDSYVVVDYFSTQRMLEWINGPGSYAAAFETPEETTALLTRTCESLKALSNRENPPFDWTGLAPDHFRSNLRMEIGLAYWNRMTGLEQAIRCDLILAR